ncbi:DNA ligase 4-like protein 1 [Phlyctema vagabunda]|uniref:DNA ligase 4-like protein 1 n=1 Tax=Phlyctema vagabunda TaxID=108571 RepID=A0ABR4PHQ4_9HELO
MQHRQRINAFDTDQDAIIRSLWVGRATGRVYGLDPKRLEQIIARALALPTAMWIELQKWELSHRDGDLAACVERVMTATSGAAVRAQTHAVTVEEIDQVLLLIASRNQKSSPAVRDLAKSSAGVDAFDTLSNIYCRLQAREAKWLTRLILKNYDPIKFPDSLDYSLARSFLPKILSARIEVQGSTTSAVLREGTSMIKGLGSTEATKSTEEARTLPPGTSQEQLGTSQAQFSCSKDPVQPRCTPERVLEVVNVSKPAWQSAVDDILTAPLSRAQVTPSSSDAQLLSMGESLSTPRMNCRSSGCYIGTGVCTIAQNMCPLANCIVLLGPCLSNVPWIIENLLPWHGSTYTTDPKAFRRPTCLPRRNAKTGARYRKILLIEANRPEQAVKLMRQIEVLNLKRSNGRKEYVEVYDWRLLECITKAEKGKRLDYNPWKRCWMCAV